MTIKESAKKWCPMVRYSLANSGGMDPTTNRHGSPGYDYDLNPSYSRCLADECACWVWDKTKIMPGGIVAGGPQRYEDLPVEDWQGHCGLAR